MVIDTTYDLGDTVYLVTDRQNRKRIVTMIEITPAGVIYGVSCGEADTKHYECEMSPDRNIDFM